MANLRFEVRVRAVDGTTARVDFKKIVRIGMVKSRRSPAKEGELVAAAKRMAELFGAQHDTWGVLEAETIESRFYANVISRLNAFDENVDHSRIFAEDLGDFCFRVYAE